MQKRRRTKEQYLRIFMQFDADNSGSISKNQIIKMFKACQMDLDQSQAEDLMNQIDADGGGQLQQDEFIQFLKRQDERIEIYNYFIDQEDGMIGFQELKHMFCCLGQKITDSQVSKMIIFADKNRDEKLDFQQFCKVLRQI